MDSSQNRLWVVARGRPSKVLLSKLLTTCNDDLCGRFEHWTLDNIKSRFEHSQDVFVEDSLLGNSPSKPESLNGYWLMDWAL